MQNADLDTTIRELRRNVALEVGACRSDGTRLDVVMTDISRGGCQLRTNALLEIGECVTVHHEVLGKLAGEVRWSCAGRVGLQFARAL